MASSSTVHRLSSWKMNMFILHELGSLNKIFLHFKKLKSFFTINCWRCTVTYSKSSTIYNTKNYLSAHDPYLKNGACNGHIQQTKCSLLFINTKIYGHFPEQRTHSELELQAEKYWFCFTKNVQDISMFHRQLSLILTIYHVGRHFVFHVLVGDRSWDNRAVILLTKQ